MRFAILLVAASFALSVALASQTQSIMPSSAAHLEAWAAQASVDLEPRVIDALQRIPSAGRRLLALRAYLRAGDTLPERWSWSEEQLSNYPATPEGRAAAADIDAVIAVFSAANPGFTLHVNRKLRSLELQISRWNVDESVGTAAAALVVALEQRLTVNAPTPTTDQIRKALIQWEPHIAIALAAPGLSAHGQGRAFDFQVEHHGQIVAGVDVASATQQWDAAGWTQKLHAAVSAAGNHFSGPLESPHEPWHYAYSPKHATDAPR